MSQVRAYVLFNATTGTPLMGQGVTAVINCAELSAFSPRRAYIKIQVPPGDGTALIYTFTADPNDPELALLPSTSKVQGWLIQQGDSAIIIDAVTDAAIQEACNACCGDGDSIIEPYYSSGIPTPFAYPTMSTFCVTRADAGSAYEHEIFGLDYVTQTVGNSRIFSSTGTSTKYQVQAYATPLAIGTDTVAAGVCS